MRCLNTTALVKPNKIKVLHPTSMYAVAKVSKRNGNSENKENQPAKQQRAFYQTHTNRNEKIRNELIASCNKNI